MDARLLDAMTQAIEHRGPDDSGTWLQGNVGLGHRRLSIIDLAGGHQPMANEDGSIWLVFNGEIYNHHELRTELLARGHRYKTTSDTETILHAYEEYGTDCVRRFRGMFAFALWDCGRNRLFAARDRFGIKPFYYWQGPDAFSFASEMKALLADPAVSVSLDAQAIYDYFTFKFIPGPRTPWQEIRRLQPAHWLLVENGQLTQTRYWQPEFKGISTASEADHLEQLEHLLKESIREHMMSEVPQGVFLSGGIDSSLIVALMCEVSTEPIRTFSIAFPGQPAFDESAFANYVAEHCHTRHFCFDCSPDASDSLSDILWHIEEPLADAAMIPLYELCRRASDEVTVIHCGDGGDEGFGGYPRFYWDQYAPATARLLPDVVRQRLLAPAFRLGLWLPEPLKDLSRRGEKYCRFVGLPAAERYMNWFTIMPDMEKHQLLHPDFLARVGTHRSAEVFGDIFRDAAALGLDPLSARQYCELNSFIPDDLMLKSDKVAMAWGLEGRFPFLDERLIEFGLALPAEHKMNRTQLKLPLKNLLARHLSDDFVKRRKHGFEVPITEWFQGRLERSLQETIEDSGGAADILNMSHVRKMLKGLQGNNPVVGRQLFKIFVFLKWQALFARNGRAARPLAAR